MNWKFIPIGTMTTADFESFVLRPGEHSNAKLPYFAVTTTVDRLHVCSHIFLLVEKDIFNILQNLLRILIPFLV